MENLEEWIENGFNYPSEANLPNWNMVEDNNSNEPLYNDAVINEVELWLNE